MIHQLDDWKNDSLLDVLSRVFEIAVTDQTEQITITAVEEDDSDFDKAIKKVVLAVSSDAKNKQMAIQMKEATKAQWRQSREDHVPVGQMIKKTETLKIQQQPDVRKSGEEAEAVTVPKENKAVNEQKPPTNNNGKNHEKETKNTKPADKNKTIPPRGEKKPAPPAAEKKQNNPSPKTEQQKTQKPNRKAEEPAAKTEKAPPVKTEEKNNSNKPAPKEKPAEKKEKNPAEHKEKNPSENKARPNNEAPGQQKKKDTPAASNNSIHKTEPRPSMDQEKKDSQAPDHSSKDEKQDQKQSGNSSKPQNEQGNKEKE
ncbi:hypothetical protein [Planococcus sp. 4-30]|uniref:hypothetical protein n=1 Tax=Planococcus sp. 4-30 TaxID=2874583 RepID=UPI001CC09747|nr:hypothetical protein [Planococcus sp. 4-30]